MIVSMTGFGDATAERNGTHYAVEIRSLNNRFYKPVIKLPESLNGLEPELESMLRDKLGRGSITFSLKMRSDSAEAAYHLNVPALQTYLQQLQQVKGLTELVRIDLAGLVALPGVCQEPRDESDEIEKHGPVVRELMTKAIAKLSAMRKKEGEVLFVDLMKQLTHMRANLKEIADLAPGVVEEYHRRLRERVNKLLAQAEVQVSQVDLIKEVAVFAERADIAEEITRLTAHLNSFEQSCRETEHGGRKLDFIAQEMLREANTIAAKANDAEIAKRIVEIKGAIDRVKEQVQNIE
ncbi:YicC/YloC family endoribonuclease [Humisphaera borealis]|uniref:YicC family protein n=1 Tax=Humisphaera borealis TaxID=2807512 RepID=A0A7M2WUB8_9BACT|nr:YicC/YloC family endoribonuclease [Humisphaera borealis]QOV88864.1 YicC family protein [Humisphaera borealis]